MAKHFLVSLKWKMMKHEILGALQFLKHHFQDFSGTKRYSCALFPSFPPKKALQPISPSAQVRRNSKYYVVSVLGVLLGISSLVFTVWCIEVDENGRGFDDQGRKGREEETFLAGGWNSICIYICIRVDRYVSFSQFYFLKVVLSEQY